VHDDAARDRTRECRQTPHASRCTDSIGGIDHVLRNVETAKLNVARRALQVTTYPTMTSAHRVLVVEDDRDAAEITCTTVGRPVLADARVRLR